MQSRAPPVSVGGRGGAMRTSTTTRGPSDAVGGGGRAATVQSLHPMSNRGREIRNDMDDMMTDYYEGNGGAAPVDRGPRSGDALPIRGGLSSPASPYFKPTVSCNAVPEVYYQGPTNAEGRMFNASDRNLLAMDVLGSMCVVGSADHGLKVFDITNGREKRNLYNKKFGHTEWVTTCVYLQDGRILSGGMDSKLCLWHASALRCDDLLGHTGSISQVDVHGGIAVSASYDRTLRVWDCDRRTCLSTLKGHGNPVTSFAWCGSLVMSGDRRGGVKMWDLESSQCIGNFETQGGQVGALGHILSETMGHLSYVGDQSGTLTVFDIRRSGSKPVFREILHPGGVIALAESIPSRDTIVTAGADRRMLCLDTRMDLAAVHEWTDHKDFIYSLKTFGNLVLSGAGNGWLLVHDAESGQCLYGLGANKAAVRCIAATPSKLVCAGDDGTAVVYDF
jgi:WD40 repeat protein